MLLCFFPVAFIHIHMSFTQIFTAAIISRGNVKVKPQNLDCCNCIFGKNCLCATSFAIQALKKKDKDV